MMKKFNTNIKNNFSEVSYSAMDECYGEVIGCGEDGVILKLDNGQEAKNNKFYGLQLGTKVLCLVGFKPRAGELMEVDINSVIYEPMVA